jgi:hypothetical protein
MDTHTATKVEEAYVAFAETLKHFKFPIIMSNKAQKTFGLKHTIFIPFDASEANDKAGFGLYLFLHEIETPKGGMPCLIATATLQLATTHHKKEVAQLLHEINLHLPVPGWILDDGDNLIHFKYLFSDFSPSHPIPESYVTILVEILNGIARSFPLLKEVIEGKSFKDIRDEIAGRLS